MNKKKKKWPWVCGSLAMLFGAWLLIRVTGRVPMDEASLEKAKTLAAKSEYDEYSYEEKRRLATCLSYLVYGSERADKKYGTVSEMLENNKMGIIIESAGVKRTDESEPSTALINTGECIKETVGKYRFVCDLQNEKNGFYGAVFADDEKKCLWMSFSGSVTFSDAVACVGFVLGPRLSGQETDAFRLLQTTLSVPEVAESGYSIYLTGHSLGGALATELSMATGLQAVTINGADGLAYDKMKAILAGDKVQADAVQPDAVQTGIKPNVTNHMTSMEGSSFSFMSLVQRMMYLGSYKSVNYQIYKPNGMTTDPHCAFSFWEF